MRLSMLTGEPEITVVRERQFARGDENNMLLCFAGGRLSPTILNQKNGTIS